MFCFFVHNYIVGGKRYSYFKIAFTSVSKPLLLSVAKTLINFGINVRMSKNGKLLEIIEKECKDKYKEGGYFNFKKAA